MKRIITGLLLVVLMAGLLACASQENSVSAPRPEPAPPPMASGSPVKTQAPVVIVPAPAPAPAPALAPSRREVSEDSSAGGSWATERMIVRTGNLALVVNEVSDTIDRITVLTENYEGYVVSSNSWREGERLVGNITVRVPAERFAGAMRAFRDLAVEVMSESTSSRDVTEEYVDLEAKLKNLEASEAQLLKLMDKAEKVEDILDIQRELSRTRGEIEQTRGRMQYLERTSDTSLIELHLEQARLDVKFTARRSTVKTGEEVRFYDEVAGGFAPYSFKWDFGDGSTSTDNNPEHKYKSTGTYTVTLEVTDDRGNSDTKIRSEYITVIPGWDAGNVASGAWSGMITFGQVMANIFIWLGIFSPVWIIIGGILFWWLRRRKKA